MQQTQGSGGREKSEDFRIPYETRLLEEMVRETNTRFDELQRVAQQISPVVARMALDPFNSAAISAIIQSLERAANEEFEEALKQKPNIELYPPLTVQFYLAALEALSPHGYVLKVEEGTWVANPKYSTLTIKAVRRDSIRGYPILGNFIYSKEDGLLATRQAILDSLRDLRQGVYDPQDSLIDPYWDTDPKDQPIHGIEISIDSAFDIELGMSKEAKKVIEALKRSNSKVWQNLRERKTVWRGPRDYGYDRAIIYLPMTPKEFNDEVPR